MFTFDQLVQLVSNPSQWGPAIDKLASGATPPKVPKNAAGRPPTGPELDRAGLDKSISQDDLKRRLGKGLDLVTKLGGKAEPYQAPQPPGPMGSAMSGSQIRPVAPPSTLPQLGQQGDQDKLTRTLLQMIQGG